MDSNKSIEIYKALSAPIAHDEIKLKIQSYNNNKTKGLIVAYIDARVAQDRLNSVLGAFGWGDYYDDVVTEKDRWVTRCTVSLYDESGKPISRSDVGSASAKQNDDENVEKGAHSDAFKRACVQFGIGRELYSLPKVWAELEKKSERVYVIKDEQAVRRRFFGGSSNGSNGNTRVESSKPRSTAKNEAKTEKTSESKPAQETTTNEAPSESAKEHKPTYASEAQVEAVKTLVKRVLGDNWSKIIEKYEPREDFHEARKLYGNDIDALLSVMTFDEAGKIIASLENYEKKLAQSSK